MGDAGQLGNGSYGPGAWLTPEVGGYASCALRVDATLWCSGAGDSGQLGLGERADRSLPAYGVPPA